MPSTAQQSSARSTEAEHMNMQQEEPVLYHYEKKPPIFRRWWSWGAVDSTHLFEVLKGNAAVAVDVEKPKCGRCPAVPAFRLGLTGAQP